jgi:hypothetical protein
LRAGRVQGRLAGPQADHTDGRGDLDEGVNFLREGREPECREQVDQVAGASHDEHDGDGRERLAWPGITHFRVRPTWVRYSDFTQNLPRVVELSADQLAG